LDELWLDHDLGEDDTIWPVVEVLERAAFEERPLDIGVINVHSANPGQRREARPGPAALGLSCPGRIGIHGPQIFRRANGWQVTLRKMSAMVRRQQDRTVLRT
jgi:hypothetical protein